MCKLWGNLSGLHNAANTVVSAQSPTPETQVSIHFLALFMAVIFAGSVVCPRAYIGHVFGDVKREQLSSDLYKGAVRALRMADFPRAPSLNTFTAFVIIDTTWLRAEQPLTCCSFVGVAVRVAQMLGE